MITKHGDLFTTDAFYIGHGVNCRGVMGAGIAKTFRDKFPLNYTGYSRVCRLNELNPGDVYSIYERSRVVINLATQLEPGADARYDAVLKSCLNAAQRVSADAFWAKQGADRRIAIPQIGCGIGGLEWDKVEHLIGAVEIVYPDVEWEVWIYG